MNCPIPATPTPQGATNPPPCCETNDCPEGTDCGEPSAVPCGSEPPTDDVGPVPQGPISGNVYENHHSAPTVQQCVDAGRQDMLKPPHQPTDEDGRLVACGITNMHEGTYFNPQFGDEEMRGEYMKQRVFSDKFGRSQDGEPTRTILGKFTPNPGMLGPCLPDRPEKPLAANLPVLDSIKTDAMHVDTLQNQERMRLDLKIPREAPREVRAIPQLPEHRVNLILDRAAQGDFGEHKPREFGPSLPHSEKKYSQIIHDAPPNEMGEPNQTRSGTRVILRQPHEISLATAEMVEKPVKMNIEYKDIGKVGGNAIGVKLSSVICATQTVTTTARGALEGGAVAAPAGAFFCLPTGPGTPVYATCVGAVVGVGVIVGAAKGAAEALDTPSCQAALGHLENQGEGRAKKHIVD